MKDELGRLQDSINGKIRSLFGHRPMVMFLLFALEDEDVSIGHISDGDVGLLPALLGYYMGRHIPPDILGEFVEEMDLGLRTGRTELWNTVGGEDEGQPLDGQLPDGAGPVDIPDSGDDKDLSQQPGGDGTEDTQGTGGD